MKFVTLRLLGREPLGSLAVDKRSKEQVQLRFLERVMGRPPNDLEMAAVTCAAAEASLFDLATLLHRRFPPRDEAKAKPVAEAAVVAAIVSMAEDGAERAFEAMAPRLRRAVRARIRTLLSVVVVNEKSGNERISVLPHGFPPDQIALALLVTMGLELPARLRDLEGA